MIFSFIIVSTLFLRVFLPSLAMSLNKTHDWNTGDISQEKPLEAESYLIDSNDNKYERNKETESVQVQNFDLDLDSNGKNERVMIKSHSELSGNQNTEVYIDSSSKPALAETGSLYSIRTHKMDNSNNYITELQLQTGQSINTLFYIYRKGKLERIPVSTEKPLFWHGIISRNSPEFKDADQDGELELLAYYNFLYDPTRKVEVYKFNGKAFNKTQEYEEVIPDKHL